MQQDTTTTIDGGFPIDGVVERALAAARTLSDAREANEESATRLLGAYDTLRGVNADLTDELHQRDLALASAVERGAHLEAEIERLKSLAREAVQAVKAAQDDAERAREETRAVRESHDRLAATNESMARMNATLAAAMDKLVEQVDTGSKTIRDGSRRLSDIVAPTPARPRAPRPVEAPAPEGQIERDMREAVQQGAGRAAPPRLVASDGARRDESILEPGDSSGLDDIIGRLTTAGGRAAG